MKFHWQKRGFVYKSPITSEGMTSHAQGPAPIIFDNVIRTFFAFRPARNLTLPTFIDLDLSDPTNIVSIHGKPILELGSPGTFDEHGIIPYPPVEVNGRIFLYYIGWSRRTVTPYCLSLGLAISEDGINFRKHADGPVLGVQGGDSLSVTAPGVIYEGGTYFMFYTAGLKWLMIDGRWEHTYTIRLATSKDGIHWDRDYRNVIEPVDEFECTSAPTVIRMAGKYHMWYSRKGSHDFRSDTNSSYRLGYAVSDDLINWLRQDQNAGIDISPEAGIWDSSMIEYPKALVTENDVFLFYNGNGFGESGFGVAKLITNENQ